MLLPVVRSFGNGGDDIFDLAFDGEVCADRHIQPRTGITGADILLHDLLGEPARLAGQSAFDGNPTRFRRLGR